MKHLIIAGGIIASCLILLLINTASVTASDDRIGGEAVDQPIELGRVKWLRDLDTAVDQSKKQSKPIALLFQEVPG